MGVKFIHNGYTFVMEECFSCKISHAFPLHVYETALNRREQFKICCPNGHEWHYKSQATIREEEAVRLERDRLRQQLAQKDDEIIDAKRKISAAKGQVTRLHNRAKAGLCSCCNRHFTNLERHMASKHKDEATLQ